MCLSDLETSHSKAAVKREKEQKLLVKDQTFETLLIQQNRSDKSSYDVCKEKKLQVSPSFGEKGVTTLSSLFAKDSVEKPKSWSLGGKLQIEPENKGLFCKIHTKSPKAGESGTSNQEKHLSEVCLADEKQWHDVSVYLGLVPLSDSRPPEKPSEDCQEPKDRPETSYRPNSEACLSESDIFESKCCRPSNFVVEAPGYMSDVQWMSLFKPYKVDRLVRQKAICTCSESISGVKFRSSASEPVITVHHASCLVASSSTLREDEKFVGTDPSLDKKNSSKVLLIPQEAVLPSEKGNCSPTSKLQRLLAESRQMVSDLELSTLLPLSSENLSSSDQNILEVSEESADGNALEHVCKAGIMQHDDNNNNDETLP